MSKKTILVVLTLVVAVVLLSWDWLKKTPAPDDQVGPNDQVGERRGSIVWDGLKRTYLLHIPPSYDKNRPMPLVIALHGSGGSGKTMKRLTLGGFNTLSDKEGFIVVYPSGVGRHWNDGREIAWHRAHTENIDDVGFISALIDHLVKELNIDQRRIYVTGMSGGALMAHRLACELSEKITAIATVAGGMPKEVFAYCSPLRPISVLIINNVDDPVIPWEGGELRLGRLTLGEVVPVSSMVKYWVTHNQCSPIPVITYEPDKDPLDGTRVRKERYEKGKDGTDVILYAIEGGGHTWPGGQQYLPERLIGKTSRDIDANEVIWNFFKKHARK